MSDPTPDSQITPEHEAIGWPPDRATVMAISAFVGNQRIVLARVAAGERITLTQRNKRVAVLIPYHDRKPLLAEEPSP